MPSLREHLDSPQFTDENGESTGESFLRFGGNWIKSGEPRRKGYAFYGIAFFGGLGLVLISLAMGDGIDLFAIFGLASMLLGIVGAVETARGRPFTKVFGGPRKPKDPDPGP